MSKKFSRREETVENTGHWKKGNNWTSGDDSPNASAEHVSEYFDAMTSGAHEEVPDMTEWSNKMLIEVVEGCWDREQNKNTQKQRSKTAWQVRSVLSPSLTSSAVTQAQPSVLWAFSVYQQARYRADICMI